MRNAPVFRQGVVAPRDGAVLGLRISPIEVVVRVAPVLPALGRSAWSRPASWNTCRHNDSGNSGKRMLAAALATTRSGRELGKAEQMRPLLARCPMIRLLVVGFACALLAGCHSSASYRSTYAARPAVVATPACPTPCPNAGTVAVPPPPAYPGY
jgi:hypothetical protein